MTKVYMVLGDNGAGNSGNAIFGLYPTQELAEKRLAVIEATWDAGEGGAEFAWVDSVDVGADGVDCTIPVEG